MYKIIRFYFNGNKRVVKSGLSLEEAQAHCQDPETSSSTCTSSSGKARTKRSGEWFDGYNECNRFKKVLEEEEEKLRQKDLRQHRMYQDEDLNYTGNR